MEVKKILGAAFAAIVAGGLCYFLPPTGPKEVTSELIAFFSIQSAVILPAMIFTAGILKPDGMELEDVEKYQRALRSQMHFWIVLLCLDFFAVSTLILCKAVQWSIIFQTGNTYGNFDLIYVLLFAFYFCGCLAIARTVPFVKGVLSLLELNSEMTAKAIRRRNERELRDRQVRSEKSPKLVLPDGYGQVFDSDEP